MISLFATDRGIRQMRRSNRRTRASGLIETVVGCTIIIPILLVLVDCAAVVIAQTANDALCKHAARAAAECQDFATGNAAAQAVIASYNAGNPTLTTAATCTVKGLPDNTTWQDVTVNSIVTVNLPVPVPFSNYNHIPFQAQSTEPVVSQLAPNAGS